jgi:thioredoxin 1
MIKKIQFQVLALALIFAIPGLTSGKTPADSSDLLAERIVKSDIPVLVDFWAPWCMPCKMVNPIIKEIAKNYAGKIKVMKINVDKHKRIAAHFKVMSIPAVFIVKDRAVVKQIPGVQSKEAYISAVEEVIQKPASKPRKTE